MNHIWQNCIFLRVCIWLLFGTFLSSHQKTWRGAWGSEVLIRAFDWQCLIIWCLTYEWTWIFKQYLINNTRVTKTVNCEVPYFKFNFSVPNYMLLEIWKMGKQKKLKKNVWNKSSNCIQRREASTINSFLLWFFKRTEKMTFSLSPIILSFHFMPEHP